MMFIIQDQKAYLNDEEFFTDESLAFFIDNLASNPYFPYERRPHLVDYSHLRTIISFNFTLVQNRQDLLNAGKSHET